MLAVVETRKWSSLLFVYGGNFPLFKIKINIFLFRKVTSFKIQGICICFKKGSYVGMGKNYHTLNLPISVGDLKTDGIYVYR